MNVELIDVDTPDEVVLVNLDETPLPGDEIQLGLERDSPVVRVVRKRYVFNNCGEHRAVRVFFRNTGVVAS